MITFAEHPSHSRFNDLTGARFGRLKVLGYAGYFKKRRYWFCKCSCGTIKKLGASGLVAGSTNSCGCLRREMAINRNLIHGETIDKKPSKELLAFINARNRCEREGDRAWRNYGGRGIEFRFNSVEELIGEVGRAPSKEHSLDRINNDGHYEPGNVRWATPLQQGNNRRDNVYLILNGARMTLKQATRATGVNYATAKDRIRRGWTPENAVINQDFRFS